MSTCEAEALRWVKKGNPRLKEAECVGGNVIIVDPDRPPGQNIVVVVVEVAYTDEQIRRRRREFRKHFSLYRNFQRQSERHRHDPRSYYSEVGQWGRGTPLLSRAGACQRSFLRAGTNFGKLAHTARGHFGAVLASLSFDKVTTRGYVRKRKREHEKGNEAGRRSIPGAEAPNGMVTADFFVQMHLDKGDRNKKKDRDRPSGYTACQSLPAKSAEKGSYFFLPEYGIKISLDEPVAWLFFGGEVVHGTTEPSFTDANFKTNGSKVGPYLTVEQTEKLLIVWGAYARAPARDIYLRNRARVRGVCRDDN